MARAASVLGACVWDSPDVVTSGALNDQLTESRASNDPANGLVSRCRL